MEEGEQRGPSQRYRSLHGKVGTLPLSPACPLCCTFLAWPRHQSLVCNGRCPIHGVFFSRAVLRGPLCSGIQPSGNWMVELPYKELQSSCFHTDGCTPAIKLLPAGMFKHRRQPGLEQYEALIQARTSESAMALPSSFGEYLPEKFENSVISPFSNARYLKEESNAKYHSRNVGGKKPMASFIFACCYLVAQSCLTLCDYMDCSPPGSSAQEIPLA